MIQSLARSRCTHYRCSLLFVMLLVHHLHYVYTLPLDIIEPQQQTVYLSVFLPHHMGFDHTATNGGWRPSYFKSIVSNLNQTTEPPIYLPPRIVDELIFVIIIFTTCFVTTVVLFSVSLFFRPPLTSPIDIGGDVENDEQLVLLLLRSQKSTNFFIVSVEVLF